MNPNPTDCESSPPPWRRTTTSALPALAVEVAAADNSCTALLVLAVRDAPARLPGLAGLCVAPFTRAQYRVESAEEWSAVLDDAGRVARMAPAGPVLIEVAPELALPPAFA
jgi:hypothetical protein